MALRAQNTMAEGLSAMLQDIGAMKALPDADLQYLIELEQMILSKVRAPVDAMAGGMSGPGPAGVNMAGGPVPGMGPGSTPPMPPPPGPPMGTPGGPPSGLAPSPQMPNADELRRVLGNPGAGG